MHVGEEDFEQHAVPFTELDVTADPAAESTLRMLYEGHRPGQHPATPVTLLATPDGAMTLFGPDIRSTSAGSPAPRTRPDRNRN